MAQKSLKTFDVGGNGELFGDDPPPPGDPPFTLSGEGVRGDGGGDAAPAPAVALQVAFERQTLKPVFT